MQPSLPTNDTSSRTSPSNHASVTLAIGIRVSIRYTARFFDQHKYHSYPLPAIRSSMSNQRHPSISLVRSIKQQHPRESNVLGQNIHKLEPRYIEQNTRNAAVAQAILPATGRLLQLLVEGHHSLHSSDSQHIDLLPLLSSSLKGWKKD